MKGKLRQILFFVLTEILFYLWGTECVVYDYYLRYSKCFDLFILYFVIQTDAQLKQFLI